MTDAERLELTHRFQRIGAKRREPGQPHIWNDEWERQNQNLLKHQYEEATTMGIFTGVYQIYCEGCRQVFYTTVFSKKYCCYETCGKKMLKLKHRAARWNERRGTVCQECGQLFTPKRNDAKYCCNACRQKAYRASQSSSYRLGNSP